MTCLFPTNIGTTAYRKGCRCRRCKDANNVWQKDYHKRHPDKAMMYIRRRMFGMEPDDYCKLLTKQKGVCAICRGINTGKKRRRPLDVDHCHITGKVRGLLCNKCNTALGLLADSISRCYRVIQYLMNSK